MEENIVPSKTVGAQGSDEISSSTEKKEFDVVPATQPVDDKSEDIASELYRDSVKKGLSDDVEKEKIPASGITQEEAGVGGSPSKISEEEIRQTEIAKKGAEEVIE